MHTLVLHCSSGKVFLLRASNVLMSTQPITTILLYPHLMRKCVRACMCVCMHVLVHVSACMVVDLCVCVGACICVLLPVKLG